MASNKGRTGKAYQQLREWVIANHNACHLCGQPVNKNLSGLHPLGPTLDHLQPLSRGGSMLDRSNARLAHRRCNSKRSDTPIPTETAHGPSRDWLPT